jgi:hypothetical protein
MEHIENTKRKISETLKRKKIKPPYWLSPCFKKGWNRETVFGKEKAMAIKEKILVNSLGVKRSKETRLKMRLAKLGKKRSPHTQETKEKIKNSNLGQKRTLETRRKMSEKKKIYWQNQYDKGIFTRKIKKIKILPILEKRLCICGCGKSFECKVNSTQKFINGHNRKNVIISKELKKRISFSMKELFKNKEHRKKVFARRIPTSLENLFILLINKYKLPYKYVGNGEVWIGNRNPDFINTNGEKKVIEVYWSGYKLKSYKTIGEYENNRINHYKKYGFRVKFFNENNINNGNLTKKDINILLK